jgi:5'-3' exonuclease
MADRLMLLDTASLYFRAYYGVPETITAPDGTPVNAVRGLLDFVARLVTDRRPTRLVACTDEDWRPAFRVAAIPGYKAHRLAPEGDGSEELVPDTLTPQVPVLYDALRALGIACVGSAGYEADDVIGTIVAHTDGVPVDVVTGDRDLFQLVDDARRVRILYTARGVGRHEIVDEAFVKAKYGIPGKAYADFALLRGDPSDGLPGVPGVGDKTAALLISKFGSAAALLSAVESGDPAVPRAVGVKIRAARDYLAVAPEVVRVASDAPLPDYDDRLRAEPADPGLLDALAERWGVRSSVDRVLAALAVATR